MDKMTLAGALEALASALGSGGLKEGASDTAASEVWHISLRLGLEISAEEAYLLAALFTKLGETMTTEDLAHVADVPAVRMLGMHSVLEGMVGKGLIYCVRQAGYRDWRDTYTLTPGVIESVRLDCNRLGCTYGEWTFRETVEAIGHYISECDDSKISHRFMVKIIGEILDGTRHLRLSQGVTSLGIKDGELALLLKCVTALVLDDDEPIMPYQYRDIIPEHERDKIVSDFKAKRGRFHGLGLLENTDEDCDTFKLTAKGRRELLVEWEGLEEDVPDGEADRSSGSSGSAGLVGGSSGGSDSSDNSDFSDSGVGSEIREKQLFYNPREEALIADLRELLMPENFRKIKERMAAVGMRTGFACLFHGAPGTGKTETVLQLAAQTGRDIVQVNLSTVRNSYVGQSEKNLQNIFDSYREKCAESDLEPILLFNEADGIFGKRLTSVRDSVDQMENTLQNIMLQNLETFDGILIATTNLTGNLDRAFERRFLYKIEFERPTSPVRQRIWQTLIPELGEADAAELAAGYDLTGGQIENVARRHLVASVLRDAPLTLAELRRLAESERLDGGNTTAAGSRPSGGSHRPDGGSAASGDRSAGLGDRSTGLGDRSTANGVSKNIFKKVV